MTARAVRLHRAVGPWVDRSALLGAAILTVSAIFVAYDGIVRWLTGTAQDWVADFAQLTLPVAIATLFVSAVHHGSMITLRAGAVSAFPRWVSRALDLFGQVVFAGLLVLIGAAVFDLAAEIAAMGQLSWFLRLPVAPTWYLVAVVLSAGAILQILRILALVAEPGAFEEPEEYPE